MSATEVVANMPLHSATVRVNKHKADWRGWKFMWPFALVFVFVFVIPILYAVYISFFQEADDRRHEVRRLQQLHSSVP